MDVRITTLVENSLSMKDLSNENLKAEWGLSYHIKTAKKNILFDTGRSGMVVENAGHLGIDLKDLDLIVLSHGHLDHSGGLRDVLLSIKKDIDVIVHPEVFSKKFVDIPGMGKRYTNMPFCREELERLGANFLEELNPYYLTDKILTTGEVPLTTDFEKISYGKINRYIDANPPVEDTLLDDQAVVLITEKGLVIILGCAHRGIINTIVYARKITGIDKVYAVIGGAHLHDAPSERLQKTISCLIDMNIALIGLNHCTGLSVCSELRSTFGARFQFNNSGSVLKFDM